MVEEIVERHSEHLKRAYQDALTASGLPEGEQTHLWRETEEVRGFSSFVLRDLRRLEEAAPAAAEQPDDPTARTDRHDLVRAVVAGLLASGMQLGTPAFSATGGVCRARPAAAGRPSRSDNLLAASNTGWYGW